MFGIHVNLEEISLVKAMSTYLTSLVQGLVGRLHMSEECIQLYSSIKKEM